MNTTQPTWGDILAKLCRFIGKAILLILFIIFAFVAIHCLLDLFRRRK